MPDLRAAYGRWARQVTAWSGSFVVMGVAFATVLVWTITGLMFGFSTFWLLLINTITTIVTFLMVFLIQNSQNIESKAIQRKLDELLRSIENADNRLMRLEEHPETEEERHA